MKKEINLQEITHDWVNGVREYYKDTGNLTQVFMRGYFTGMSEREVKAFADMLFDNNDKAPSDHFTESRAKHPLTTKEEADRQVAEFDKVQPINKGSSERIIHKGGGIPADCHLNSNIEDEDENEEWEEVYDIIDTIVEERDRYKKALKDLREWAKQEEHIWSLGKEMDCFVATHYYAMLEEIDKTLKETYKIEIGGETIDFPKD